MFESARLQLTLWYMLLMMVISASFSVVVYRLQIGQIKELELQQRRQHEYFLRDRYTQTIQCTTDVFGLQDLGVLSSAKPRLQIMLLSLNGFILALATGLSYFLAGKTLAPIRQMMSRQQRFVSDVSHDLKTPLAAMKTELEVNLRDPKLDLATAKHILRSNVEEVNQLYQLCQQLLQLTIYDRPRAILKSLTSADEIVESALKKVKALAADKHIQLSHTPVAVSFLADQASLVTALTILLDNAIKYSPEQSVIELSVETSPRHVSFNVVDHGRGIPAADVPHIFDRFYRVDTSRTKQTGTTGYGLGLAIAYSIVSAHGGSIKVKSAEGKGSTFSIRVPR